MNETYNYINIFMNIQSAIFCAAIAIGSTSGAAFHFSIRKGNAAADRAAAHRDLDFAAADWRASRSSASE
jgi:hypothetical protein